jgi:hypothetical protein
MKTHRIATLGHDSYILPEKFSIEDSLRFLDFLAGCRKVNSQYVADKQSRYNSVLVVDETQLEVAVMVTAAPVLTREQYTTAQSEGEAAYRAAHPEPQAVAA